MRFKDLVSRSADKLGITLRAVTDQLKRVQDIEILIRSTDHIELSH